MSLKKSDEPPKKRSRLDTSRSSQNRSLFAPFRALGLVTNNVPLVIQTRSFKGATDGPRVHILTCLGRSWALWEGSKMTLLFIGSDSGDEITSLAMDGNHIYAAAGSRVLKYLRGKEIQTFQNPFATRITLITIFGTSLLALTEDGTKLLVWDTSDHSMQYTIQFEADFTATGILHPATYLNKVIISSRQGTMQLWNIKTNSCIHKFSNTLLSNSSMSGFTGITALSQSPAIDVIGIGFSSGEIIVHDIRTDERLMRIFMDGGNVRALGFRGDGHPILASASAAGNIALWDLNEGGRLLHIIRGAHDGAVTAIEWIPGQPVLISSGEDNAVKQWLFDSPTSSPRLLKFRSGHQAPPHLIRYYGEDGKDILSASRDRSLRCISIVRDSRSYELSQGSLAKQASSLSIPLASLKLPPISSIAYSTARAKDWGNVITAHAEEPLARTWTTQSKKIGQHTFKFAEGKKTKSLPGYCQTVCVTTCGNFGLAGSSTGLVQMWNMQSGILRKSFDIGLRPADMASKIRSKKSNRAITGLATDALNSVVVASTLDGTVNFFDFSTTKLEHTLALPSSVVSLVMNHDSGLLATVCDDMIIRVIDLETRKVVRELGGFRGRILDIAFSADSRWIIATALDSVIRTFDVPTGRLIDAFRTASVATSVTFSPTGDFLATAHIDSIGIYLWANRAQYGEVSFQGIRDDEITEVSLPSMQSEEDQVLEDLSVLSVEATPTSVFSTPDQLDTELVTLTHLPRTRWQSLLNFDIIQQRNKPKEPPKAPEKAPFFLPTLPGVETRFDIQPKTTNGDTKKATRRLDKIAASTESVFVKKLTEEDRNGNYEEFFEFAKGLSPAALDLELRLLVSLEIMQTFLHALIQRLLSHRDFEAVQTLQNVFLRLHGDVVMVHDELADLLEQLMDVQKQTSDRVLELIASSLGTLSFVRETL